MNEWKKLLKADPTDWLLEEDNPSVRYYTLTEILDKPSSDNEIKEAKRQIMEIGPVPKILEKQNPLGHWEEPERFYTAKYKGTAWQLMILAELGTD